MLSEGYYQTILNAYQSSYHTIHFQDLQENILNIFSELISNNVEAFRVFQIAVRGGGKSPPPQVGGGSEILLGRIFLLVDGNLRSDFGNSEAFCEY